MSRSTARAATGAALALLAAQHAHAQLTFTAAERSVDGSVAWFQRTGGISHGSASDAHGPSTALGTFDETAYAYADDDTGQTPAWSEVTAHHNSVLSPSSVTAELTIDVNSSLESVPVRSDYASFMRFNFSFTIGEPTPIVLDSVWDGFGATYAEFRFGNGNGFYMEGFNLSFPPSHHFEGVLNPGTYNFSSYVNFVIDDLPSYTNFDWGWTFSLTATPTPGVTTLLAIAAIPATRRRRA